MTIQYYNRDIINSDIYIHDCIFKGLQFKYDKEKKNIATYFLDADSKTKQYTIEFMIEFCNVIAFDMIVCDFWGASPHILDWEIIDDDQRLISKLFREKQKHGYQDSKLDIDIKYIESEIIFASGDKLTIVCENINIPTQCLKKSV